MRLRSLSVAGFRGFNECRDIVFDSSLTLVAACNSYGKTSITEALEFLFYGQTSKVRRADSKEEYKESYRNRHYPATEDSYIEVVADVDNGTTSTLRVTIDSTEKVTRYIDSQKVENWPFADQLKNAAEPFVLQHALKYLLLVPPDQRFQGFARLLGLDAIDDLQRVIVSLCTKPESKIPEQAKALQAEYAGLVARLSIFSSMQGVIKELKKGHPGLAAGYTQLEKRIGEIVGTKVTGGDCHPALVKLRDTAVSKVFSGKVTISQLSERDQLAYDQLTTDITSAIDESLIEKYALLAAKGVSERLQLESNLFAIGTELLTGEKDICPFCGQKIGPEQRSHIEQTHLRLQEATKGHISPDKSRTEIKGLMAKLRKDVVRHSALEQSRSQSLVQAWPLRDKIKEILGTVHKEEYKLFEGAHTEISQRIVELITKCSAVEDAVTVVEQALDKHTEAPAEIEALGKAIKEYFKSTENYQTLLSEHEEHLVAVGRALQRLLDELAGTKEVAIAIELLEQRKKIDKALRIQKLLDDLKFLKKEVEQGVAEAMSNAISGDFTGTVMDWYRRIRTTGDPDVHFAGFEMERTKTGDFKSRKLRIRAQSYGVELASAVSSLSESKLNALGLCVSIACVLRAPGPWGFLVLDDPIQSWDDEHEEQFITVVRSIVESGKQVILLSHKGDWINRVREGCRTLNGVAYEITAYTKEGPHVCETDWSPIDQRLSEVDAIAKDTSATSTRLQQGDEEIRTAICQIASAFSSRKLKVNRSPHSLNSQDVRKILVTCGVEAKLTDEIVATFEVTDDAHHAPKKYQPNRERLRQFHSKVNQLRTILKAQ